MAAFPARLLGAPPMPGAGAPAGAVAGTLVVHGDALVWTPHGDGGAAVTIPLRSVAKMQKSPDGKPEVKLRVVLADGGAAWAFELGGEAAQARANREAVVDAHRRAAGAAAPPPPPPAPKPAAAAVPAGNLDAHLGSTSAASRKGREIARAAGGAELDPLAGRNVRALKAAVLETHPPLRAQYTAMVGGGMVGDAEFWQGRRQLLVDAALAQPTVGLSSRMPETLGRVTAGGGEVGGGSGGGGGSGSGGGGGVVKLDAQAQLAIFKREPSLREAFTAFVPVSLTARDFWLAYVNADRERKTRRQQLEDGQLLGGGGGSGGTGGASGGAGGAGGSGATGPAARRLADIPTMAPADFFETFRRGEWAQAPPRGAGGGSGGAGAPHPGGGRRRSAMGSLDPGSDLLATAEDAGQAAGARGGGGRGGYGTGEERRVYAAAVDGEAATALLGSGGGNADAVRRLEAARRHERTAETIIADVNAYSLEVVDAVVSSAGGGRAGGRAVGSGRGAVRADASASTTDDLSDLYVPRQPALLPLAVDVTSYREALAAQGGAPEPADVDGSSAGRLASSGTGAASGAGRGGGWSVWGDSGTPASADGGGGWQPAPAAAGAGEGAGTGAVRAPAEWRGTLAGREPGGAKRKRPDDDGGDSGGAPPDAARLTARLPQPDPLATLSGKAPIAAAKKVMRALTRASHDLFAAADRSRSGMLRTVPRVWREFVVARSALHRELLYHLWPTLLTEALREPKVAEKRAALVARVTAEYEALERTKADVLARGAHALLPPPVDAGKAGAAGGRAVEAEVVAVPDTEAAGRRATSDLVALVNLLQATLSATLQRAEEVAAKLAAGPVL